MAPHHKNATDKSYSYESIAICEGICFDKIVAIFVGYYRGDNAWLSLRCISDLIRGDA